MRNQVVSPEEWLKARLALLAAEKESARQRDAPTRRRMAMPWERVEKSYRFQGPGGAVSLGDLFDGRSAAKIAIQRESAGACAGSGHAAVGAADWLCLAAAPTFAVMALLTAVLGGGAPDVLCSAANDASPLSGMVPMYLLMSAFHSAPWLKLVSSQRSGARRSFPA
jgi:hypothetical protein